MLLFFWLLVAWLAGTLAILGSLMAVASLLLWLIPTQQPTLSKSRTSPSDHTNFWKGRLKVFLFALALAILGLSTLTLIPFPSY